jgi:hypothetical protein
MSDETDTAAELDRLRDANAKLSERVDELTTIARDAAMSDEERAEAIRRAHGKEIYRAFAADGRLPPLREDSA